MEATVKMLSIDIDYVISNTIIMQKVFRLLVTCNFISDRCLG